MQINRGLEASRFYALPDLTTRPEKTNPGTLGIVVSRRLPGTTHGVNSPLAQPVRTLSVVALSGAVRGSRLFIEVSGRSTTLSVKLVRPWSVRAKAAPLQAPFMAIRVLIGRPTFAPHILQ
jgi:hypothetical protein